MKNVSRIVSLILAASAGVWLSGCAAEMTDSDEDTDIALANVEQGGSNAALGSSGEKAKENAGLSKGGQVGAASEEKAGAASEEKAGASAAGAGQDAANEEGGTAESKGKLSSYWWPGAYYGYYPMPYLYGPRFYGPRFYGPGFYGAYRPFVYGPRYPIWYYRGGYW
jgi:hypothetical protein